jgi:adenylate kinase family enzyme
MGERKQPNPTLFVIFGIPGAGKTTVANLVIQQLLTRKIPSPFRKILHLDLDDCVPGWM